MNAEKDVALTAAISALDKLNLAALQKKWQELYKVPAPIDVRCNFLRRAIAYKIREDAYGGLSPGAKRKLQQLAEQIRNGEPLKAEKNTSLKPGVRLMREWRGEMEVVDVTESGFLWRDRTFVSLSAVATEITGTKWSGPRFFGIASRKSAVISTQA